MSQLFSVAMAAAAAGGAAPMGRPPASLAETLEQLRQGQPIHTQLPPGLETQLLAGLEEHAERLLADPARAEEAPQYLQRACRTFPGHGRLWTALAGVQIQLNDRVGALSSYQQALLADPQLLLAREGLDRCKTMAVERWHFRMLNDGLRNAAFEAALTAAVARRPGCSVLDIGAGTGILAMMALRAGATKAQACELNRVLCATARACAAANSVSPAALDIILGKSTQLCVEEVDGGGAASGEAADGAAAAPVLRQRADIVVAELVDAGLLGEHIISVLQHAAHHLLAPGGEMIPRAANVFVALIESEEIRRRKGLVASDGSAAPTQLAGGLLTLARLRFVPDEHYTCEPLVGLPHRLLTAPQMLCNVVFAQADALSSPEDPAVVEIQADGVVDGLMLYFDLLLTDDADRSVGAGEITISTSPARGWESAWDQAIYFLDRETGGVAGGRQARRGSAAALSASLADSGSLLDVSVRLQEDAERAVDMAVPVLVKMVPEPTLAYFNNHVHHTQLAEAVQRVAAISEGSEVNVLDLAGPWGLGGLVAAKHLPTATVSVYAGDEANARALRELVEDTGLGGDERVLVYEGDLETALDELLPGASDGDAEQGLPMWLLTADFVETSGVLRDNVLDDWIAARSHLTAQPGLRCICVPARIVCFGMAIESPFAMRQNRVEDEATCGLDLSALNAFAAVKMPNVDLGRIPHSALSAPQRLLELDLASLELERGLYGGKGRRTKLKVVDSGVVHAIAVWFEVHLDAGAGQQLAEPVLDFGPRQSAVAHARQVLFMLGTDLDVDLAGPGQALDGALPPSPFPHVSPGERLVVATVCAPGRGIDVQVEALRHT